MQADASFLGLLSSISNNAAQPTKKFQDIDNNVTDIYDLMVKENKAEEDQRKKEKRNKERLAQVEKRKKSFAPMAIFATKGERKKGSNDLRNKILLGLGILGAGAAGTWVLTSDDEAAVEIRETVTEAGEEFGNMLKDEIEKYVTENFDKMVAEIKKWTKNIVDGTARGTSTVMNSVTESVRNSVGGRGATKKGTVFTYGDVVESQRAFRDLGLNMDDPNNATKASQYEDLKKLMRFQKEDRDSLNEVKKEKPTDDAGKKKQAKEIARLKAALTEREGQITEAWELLGISDEALRVTQEQRLGMFKPKQYQAKQLGGISGQGPFVVPGYGDGDQFPMLLPAGSFVLNREASQHLQTGGEVGIATKHIMKDEALSSLTKGPFPKGKSDWIRPNGNSVISKTPWNKVKPETPIYSYVDSVGVPTIGWGSTYYDNISNGKKKVKNGDVITKRQADKALHTNIAALNDRYSKEINHWDKMADKQKAALLSMGYNAPNFFSSKSFAPKLRGALQRGDMKTAAANLDWGGPSRSRVKESQQMLLQGPNDLSKLKGPKIVGQGKVGRKIVGTGNALLDMARGALGFGKVGSIKRQMGGAVDNRRFDNIHDGLIDKLARKIGPQVVVVKRSGKVSLPGGGGGGPSLPGGGETSVNIVEMRKQLHRLSNGARM